MITIVIVVRTPSAIVSFVQDSMALLFQCELQISVKVSLPISNQVT